MFLVYYLLTGVTIYVARQKELDYPGFYVVVGLITLLSLILF